MGKETRPERTLGWDRPPVSLDHASDSALWEPRSLGTFGTQIFSGEATFGSAHINRLHPQAWTPQTQTPQWENPRGCLTCSPFHRWGVGSSPYTCVQRSYSAVWAKGFLYLSPSLPTRKLSPHFLLSLEASGKERERVHSPPMVCQCRRREAALPPAPQRPEVEWVAPGPPCPLSKKNPGHSRVYR